MIQMAVLGILQFLLDVRLFNLPRGTGFLPCGYLHPFPSYLPHVRPQHRIGGSRCSRINVHNLGILFVQLPSLFGRPLWSFF